MRAAALVARVGERGRAVLLKKEAGTVTGLKSTGDTRGGVLTKTGSGSMQARADGARTLGGSDIVAEGLGVLKTGIVGAAGITCGLASCLRQEAC